MSCSILVRRLPLPILALLGLVVALSACRAPQATGLQRFEFQRPFMGTLFGVILYAAHQPAARAAADAAFARIAALENVMSDYDPDSELMRLCRATPGQPVPVSAELFDVLQRAQRVAAATDGAFDVTLGPLARLWRRARRTGELPSTEALARARESVGWQKLRLDSRRRTVTLLAPKMQLDLGGIGKGYAADAALAVLKRHGIARALVAAGGDIAVGEPPPGKPGWRVSIAAPPFEAPGPVTASRSCPSPSSPFLPPLLLKNAGVSTSGDAEQFVEIGGRRYSHILDPRTGLGLTERVQVTVVARCATDSDSLATALSVLGVERGLALVETRRDLAALILRNTDGRIEAHPSRRFQRIPCADTAPGPAGGPARN